MPDIHYAYKDVLKRWMPTAYPVKTSDTNTSVPSEISRNFTQLTTFIEDKYTKEFLKVCAYYNKMFISLKSIDYARSSYNTVPFTLQNQERTDTGTGMAANYLKSAIDLVVSRIGNVKFDYKLKSEQPTVEYTIYKDEIERLFRSLIRKNNLPRLGLESFHDAAILGFAHAFIDPWLGTIRKLSDWELGFYESEFVDGQIVHAMVRDFSHPTALLGPYLAGFSQDKIESWMTRDNVDMRLYFDCKTHKKYVCINGDMSPATDYPFDHLLIATLSWDLGVRRTTVASLFDSLYPLQRQMDKLLAKKTQLLNQYKGPVPVFSGTDYDIVMKQINNSAGEFLFLDTNRRATDLITTLEPTPLDPTLNAEMESIKAQMFEIAAVHQINLELESARSAAQVIAVDQIRDAGFQSQLTALSQYINDIVDIFVTYQAKVHELGGDTGSSSVDWSAIRKLLDNAFIDIVPIHKLEQTGLEEDETPDFMLRHVEQFIVQVLKGTKSHQDLDFSFDQQLLREVAVQRYVEFRAMNDNIDSLDRLRNFLIELFIDDVAANKVPISTAARDDDDEAGGVNEQPENMPPPPDGMPADVPMGGQ